MRANYRNLLGLMQEPGVGAAVFSLRKGSTPRPNGLGEEKMESPPRFGLGTINIVPLCGRTTIRV